MQTFSIGLATMLAAACAMQGITFLGAFIPPGVVAIATLLLVGYAISLWVQYLKDLRLRVFHAAKALHESSKEFGFLLHDELLRAELDLRPEDRNDLQTVLYRVEQFVPVVGAVAGIALELL